MSVVLLSGMTTLGSELALVSRPPEPNSSGETGGPGLCSRSLSGELAYDNRSEDMGKRKSSESDSSGCEYFLCYTGTDGRTIYT